MINVGVLNELRVTRKTDLGYMLFDEDDNEVLLHFNEASRELTEEEMVTVFVYYDKKKRITATMNTPFVMLDTYGFVTVKEVINNVGVFVDINTAKDSLVSCDYLPYNLELWPTVGSTLLVTMKHKRSFLECKPLNKIEILDIKHDRPKLVMSDMVEAFVFRTQEAGINLVTKDFNVIFVHKTQMRTKFHLGQKVDVRIISVKEDEYNGSLIDLKQNMLDSDSKIILEYLTNCGGKMKYTAKSTSEEIEKAFKLSRKAFKRALGLLYKEKKVDFIDDEYTVLI
ncbi:MAG: S1-like domain-containing RNA-binding protein [Anaeroplasmataceae bacterium]